VGTRRWRGARESEDGLLDGRVETTQERRRRQRHCDSDGRNQIAHVFTLLVTRLRVARLHWRPQSTESR
jgi:hypothetical protein